MNSETIPVLVDEERSSKVEGFLRMHSPLYASMRRNGFDFVPLVSCLLANFSRHKQVQEYSYMADVPFLVNHTPMRIDTQKDITWTKYHLVLTQMVEDSTILSDDAKYIKTFEFFEFTAKLKRRTFHGAAMRKVHGADYSTNIAQMQTAANNNRSEFDPPWDWHSIEEMRILWNDALRIFEGHKGPILIFPSIDIDAYPLRDELDPNRKILSPLRCYASANAVSDTMISPITSNRTSYAKGETPLVRIAHDKD